MLHIFVLFYCQVGDSNMDSFVLVLNMYLFIMLFLRWMRNDICVFFCVWLMNDKVLCITSTCYVVLCITSTCYVVLCITSTCYVMEELLCLLVFCSSSMIPLLHTNGQSNNFIFEFSRFGKSPKAKRCFSLS